VRLLCITDPLTHPPFDATVLLYNRIAADRRFEFYHLEASRVGMSDEIPVLRIPAPLAFQEFCSLAERPTVTSSYAEFDLVFSRTDKPYPPAFLPGLIRQEQRTRFVARPSSVLACDVRSFYRAHADRFLPPGLVTRSVPDAATFVRATGATVAKRNRSYGGKGVSRIVPGGTAWRLELSDGESHTRATIEELVELLFAHDPEPYEFVRFLPRVTAGDKRALVVEDQVYGAFLRVATDGGWINNLTHGAIVKPATLTDSELQVIEATRGAYLARGLPALGYDFLQDDSGEWLLSEINASGNISGYRRIEEVGGPDVYPWLLDWLLDLAAR